MKIKSAFCTVAMLIAVPVFGATLNVPAQYSTVQAAIDAANAGDIISIANGSYTGPFTIAATKNHLTFIGASQSGVVLHCNGTNQITFNIYGTDITFEYLTIRQDAGQNAGNANHAIYVNSARVEFYYCNIYGWQDTFAIWTGAVIYCKNCQINGSVDFIYSAGTAFFDACKIRQIRAANPPGGVNCAPSTPASVTYGLVFSSCTICRASGVPDNSSTLMRPWGAYGETAYLNCAMDSHITALGWSPWNGAELTCRAAEYGSTTLSGATIDLSQRASWVVRLTAAQAATYSKANVLGGWNPPL